jgi:hypothetical protein
VVNIPGKLPLCVRLDGYFVGSMTIGDYMLLMVTSLLVCHELYSMTPLTSSKGAIHSHASLHGSNNLRPVSNHFKSNMLCIEHPKEHPKDC